MPRDMVDNSNESELDKYINDIGDIKDDSDQSGDNGGDNNVDNNPNGTADGTPADKNTQIEDQNSAPASGNKEGQTPKEGQQPGKGGKDGTQPALRPLGDGTFADAKGNITDDKGKVIAESGFAARMYNANKRMKTQLEERTQQLNEIASSVGELKSLATSIRSYNLENTEVAQALDLAGRMKRGDHVGVAKEVLAMIVAQGYNITDLLGGDVGDTVEMKAIQRMLDERLAPITRQEQSRVREQEVQTTAMRQYQQFVSQNEHAEVHADVIAALAKRDGITVQTAYNRLLETAYQNGLDFSQPLRPQILARKEAAGNPNGQQPQNKPNAQTKPMPNGAATRMNGGAPQIPMASADDDWGSIIKDVQRTIGVH